MQIINSPKEFHAICKTLTGTIGFVPTMGNLHDGHASLLKRSRAENDVSVLSIFVNPTQFNNPDDLKNYPKTLEQDLVLAEKLNVDYVFLPNPENMYPDNFNYKIIENNISQILEGAHRPGHFEGVLTIVLKLLLITQPTRAYFGEKDYQQYLLIKNMVNAFFIETEIIGCPTIRNKNNLPLSSRNNLFTDEQFDKVQEFSRIFHDEGLTTAEISQELTSAGFEVEYITEVNKRRFAAIKYVGVRLIDNVEVKL